MSLKQPTKLKLFVGAQVILTDNISIADRLISGAICTGNYLDKRSKSLCRTIYVKFDDPKVGNSLKNRGLCGDLKECVPITARTKRFP